MNTNKLTYTVPLVIYGIFRYLYVIYRSDSDGGPTEVVLIDKSIISIVLLWALLVIRLIYGEINLINYYCINIKQNIILYYINNN